MVNKPSSLLLSHRSLEGPMHCGTQQLCLSAHRHGNGSRTAELSGPPNSQHYVHISHEVKAATRPLMGGHTDKV